MKIKLKRKLPAPPKEETIPESFKQIILRQVPPVLKPGEKLLLLSSKGIYSFLDWIQARKKQYALLEINAAPKLVLHFANGSEKEIALGTDFAKAYADAKGTPA